MPPKKKAAQTLDDDELNYKVEYAKVQNDGVHLVPPLNAKYPKEKIDAEND